MKFLILTALVAVAVAEPEAKADPYYLHTAGYASPYTAAYGYKAAPYAYGASPYAYAQPAAYYTGAHLLGKREAEAEPEADAEADPAYLHYGGYASPYAATYGYRAVAPYAYGVSPYTYAKPAYYTGAHFLGKREAEAEPEADAEADPAYLQYGGYASPYAATYGYRAAAPYAYGASPYAYAQPAAYYTGAHYLGKREAEAEPQYGYTYGGRRFGSPYGYGYGRNYFGRFPRGRYGYYY